MTSVPNTLRLDELFSQSLRSCWKNNSRSRQVLRRLFRVEMRELAVQNKVVPKRTEGDGDVPPQKWVRKDWAVLHSDNQLSTPAIQLARSNAPCRDC